VVVQSPASVAAVISRVSTRLRRGQLQELRAGCALLRRGARAAQGGGGAQSWAGRGPEGSEAEQPEAEGSGEEEEPEGAEETDT